MTGYLELINNALTHIGWSPLVSIEDLTPEGNAARMAWRIAWPEFLADHDWSFATRSDVLREFIPIHEEVRYSFLHLLPVDFERLIEINKYYSSQSAYTFRNAYARQLYGYVQRGAEWEIILVDDLRLLASFFKDVSIRYVSNDFSLDNLSAPAKSALTFKIALHMDAPLNGGTLFNQLSPLYAEAYSKALTYEGTTKSRMRTSPTPLERVRNG